MNIYELASFCIHLIKSQGGSKNDYSTGSLLISSWMLRTIQSWTEAHSSGSFSVEPPHVSEDATVA